MQLLLSDLVQPGLSFSIFPICIYFAIHGFICIIDLIHKYLDGTEYPAKILSINNKDLHRLGTRTQPFQWLKKEFESLGGAKNIPHQEVCLLNFFLIRIPSNSVRIPKKKK
jgi:hypothetical protein